MNPDQYTPDNYDAFISYRHDSGFFVAQVIFDKLILNGYSVFMDKRLERGEFEPQLRDAVEKSRNFILVLFPHDLDGCDREDDWLRKEADWACGVPNMNFIPVFCDNFTPTDELLKSLPEGLRTVLGSQKVELHKSITLDSELDWLCDISLKNANPVKPMINTVEFFNSNLNQKHHLSVKSIDMAFHGGGAWLRQGRQMDLMKQILQRRIPTRILINTPKAAQSITKHMHDSGAMYFTFQQLTQHWKRLAEENSEFLQVRACPIPLLRAYHNVRFSQSKNDRMHVKYYAYQNLNLDNAYEHELSSFSKYYDVYQKEFEYLWNESCEL